MHITAHSLIELGQILREIRESKQLSLSHISADLRIRSLYLQALEQGDWQQLPARTYGRGYLRRYAEYLGLDAAEILQLCAKLQQEAEPKLHYFAPNSNPQTPSNKLIIAVAIIFVVISIGWVIIQHWNHNKNIPPYGLGYELPSSLYTTWQQAKLNQPISIITHRNIPWPPAVQECLRILRPARNPCYYPVPKPHILARQFAVGWPKLID